MSALAQTLPAPTSGTLDIWWKAPLASQTVSGVLSLANCYIKGSGVTRVNFFLDDKQFGSDTNVGDGMSCNLDTRLYANGTHKLRATAYNSTGQAYNEVISINIQNTVTPTPTPTPTTTLPAPTSGTLDIWWKAPLASQTVSGVLSLANCYVKGSGVTRVNFFLDDKQFGSDTNVGDGMSCNLDTRLYPNGSHKLRATAYNSAGTAYNEVIAINIQNSATPTPNPTPTPTPTPTPSTTISAADILSQARHDTLFAQQPGYSAQTIGTHTSSTAIPETGINGTVLPNGERLRIGKVNDPSNSAKKALHFQLGVNDPITSGSHRSELSMGKNIELDKTYWVAYRVYVYNWGTLSSGDVSITGMQLHSGNDSLGLSPALAVVTADSGRNWEILTLSSSNPTNPTSSNQVSKRYGKHAIPFGRWVDVVIKLRQSTGSSGMMQAWFDGTQIASHTGPIGFYTPGYKDYFKFGYYNWSSYNSSRKVLLQAPTVVADPTGSKYTPADLRAHINAPAANPL